MSFKARASRTILSLPMHPYLTADEVNLVVEALDNVTTSYSK
jgi:dTDP-4-amino-4,6-dideoxygalactose transaminase